MIKRIQVVEKLVEEYGFLMFPIKPGHKFPPLIRAWQKNATNDVEALRQWWAKWPDANIGIHTKGLVVIDIDVKKDGFKSFEEATKGKDVPTTLVNCTPTGGQHIIYRLPEGHPGVANGVDVLGPGVDIRSTNGYIVGFRSNIGDKEYRAGSCRKIAEAPEWLVQKLQVFTERERDDEVNIPDAPPHIVRQASNWLADQEPAIEGAGGDEATYKVCAGLHDFGLSVQQATAMLEEEWNPNCQPPWDHKELSVKVLNAYKYSQEAAGNKVATMDDFEITEEEHEALQETVEKPRLTLGLRQFAELATGSLRPREALIKGVLQRGSFAQLYGEPGKGKTFLALDMALHVATGMDWMGHKVTKPGPVLYLAFEGVAGIADRFRGLLMDHKNQMAMAPEDVPLYVVDASSFDLRLQADRAKLNATVKEMARPPVLVVIDTFARAMQGGDENSASDVGQYLAAVASMVAHNVTVLHLHHPGKDLNKGARGSSAIKGALDTELEVRNFEVVTRKQRDIQHAAPIPFKLETVKLGKDEDGDELTTCVVHPGEGGGSTSRAERLDGMNKLAWDELVRMDKSNAGVPYAEWKSACSHFLSEKPGSARMQMGRARDRLMKMGLIDVEDEMVTRTYEESE